MAADLRFFFDEDSGKGKGTKNELSRSYAVVLKADSSVRFFDLQN